MDALIITTEPQLKKLLFECLQNFAATSEITPQVRDEINNRNPATRKEAAAFLGISLKTLNTLLRTSQLKYFNIGSSVRIEWSEIKSFIERQNS